MSKKIIIDGKLVTLYTDDGRTWASRKRDLREYRRRLKYLLRTARLTMIGATS